MGFKPPKPFFINRKSSMPPEKPIAKTRRMLILLVYEENE
jgi:hypothetical protein